MRHIGEAAKYLVITLAVLYALDLSVFQVRHLGGGGMSSVQVDRYLSTSLKGNKAEYDYLGTVSQNCSRSLFPQYAAADWNLPCWWLQHHTARWE